MLILFQMKLLLQHRILIGYIILIAVIGSMAAIMFYERNRVQNIEMFISVIRPDAVRFIRNKSPPSIVV